MNERVVSAQLAILVPHKERCIFANRQHDCLSEAVRMFGDVVNWPETMLNFQEGMQVICLSSCWRRIEGENSTEGGITGFLMLEPHR